MKHLFTSEGEAALIALLRRRPLLAFDFDGTLAPIVAFRHLALMPTEVATRLATLASRLPVAIVTGRSVADVSRRLRFEPQYIVGSHGAEDAIDPASAAERESALDPLRQLLTAKAGELAAAGVDIEDKRQSIALHYRMSREPARALALIDATLASSPVALHTFAGKKVVNALLEGAPDKAHAVNALVARSGADCALFAGDDVNDEPVFATAPPTWLTVRIGGDDPASKAQYFLDSPDEMTLMLERLLVHLPGSDPAPPDSRP